MIDLPPKLILKIAVSVPDSAMPQWKPPWHDLLKAAASVQAVIGFALRSVGAVRLWPRFQPTLHMCNCFVFDEIARRRCHPELEHNDLLDLQTGSKPFILPGPTSFSAGLSEASLLTSSPLSFSDADVQSNVLYSWTLH